MSTRVDGAFDHLLPEVQEVILRRDLRIPKAGDEPGLRAFRGVLAEILLPRLPQNVDVNAVAERFARMMTGLGILQPLVDDPDVEEVIVRPGGHVYVDRRGHVEYLGVLAPDRYFYQLASYFADTSGRPLSPQHAAVITDLPGGERFTALVPPLSPEGTAINVRTFRLRRYTLDELIALGTFSSPDGDDRPGEVWARRLRDLAAGLHASILISGAFSAGKTTLLNALMAFLPDTAMVAVAETFRELRLPHDGAVRVVVPPSLARAGERISLGQAINVLLTRARPDVIVLGEITSHEEAVEYLRAANLGVRAWATVHGNGAEESLVRVADLAVRSGVPLLSVRSQVAQSVDLVVHMARAGKRRYVAEIVRVRGVDDRGQFILDTLYRVGVSREEMLDRILSGPGDAATAPDRSDSTGRVAVTASLLKQGL